MVKKPPVRTELFSGGGFQAAFGPTPLRLFHPQAHVVGGRAKAPVVFFERTQAALFFFFFLWRWAWTLFSPLEGCAVGHAEAQAPT